MNTEIILSVFAVFVLLTVTTAQEGSSECQYTSCENGGSCYREDGVEICFCSSNHTGVFCELSRVPCDEYECENGGSCYTNTGIATCVCNTGYSGVRCENINEAKQCPVTDDSDMIFLPTCTLKSTLSQLSDCINYQLPFLMSYESNAVEQCNEKITRTKHCFYRTIQECSETACNSAYLYGGAELYANIAPQLFNPSSNFSRALHGILCSLPDSNGVFPYPPKFNIGEPVCKSTLIDHLIRIMANSSTNYPFGQAMQSVCLHLKNLKYTLYNETKMSCDFTNLRDALPYLINPQEMPQYWENLLEMSQEYFLEWVIPVCRDIKPPSPCDNYCMYGGFCTLNDDGPFCACPEYRGGARCEMPDPTNVCPVPGEGDTQFLPLCTLRSTTDQTIGCFTDLVMASMGRSDFQTCSARILPALTCFARVVRNCSRSTCPSVWNILGAPEVGKEMFRVLFSANVTNGMTQLLCNPPPAGGYIQFVEPFLANFSIPFCNPSFMSDLFDAMRYLESGLIVNPDLRQSCNVIQEVQRRLAGVLDQCDFSAIGMYVPPETQAVVTYLQGFINAAKSMLRNYVLPICRDVGVGDGNCPMVTQSSSRCQLADAWMCNYFNYAKSFSQWTSEFVDWLQGCDGFHERNWDDWASSAGLMRGDKSFGGQMAGGYGTNGFIRMIKANFRCPEMAHDDCNLGQRFTTTIGCTICYRPGSHGNTRNMLTLWMQEFQNHQLATEGYKKLREDCIRSAAGCDGEIASTTAPFPTFSSGFSSTFHPTGSTPPFTSTFFGSTFSSSSIPQTFTPHSTISSHSSEPTQTSTSSTPPSTPTSTTPSSSQSSEPAQTSTLSVATSTFTTSSSSQNSEPAQTSTSSPPSTSTSTTPSSSQSSKPAQTSTLSPPTSTSTTPSSSQSSEPAQTSTLQ